MIAKIILKNPEFKKKIDVAKDSTAKSLILELWEQKPQKLLMALVYKWSKLTYGVSFHNCPKGVDIPDKLIPHIGEQIAFWGMFNIISRKVLKMEKLSEKALQMLMSASTDVICSDLFETEEYKDAKKELLGGDYIDLIVGPRKENPGGFRNIGDGVHGDKIQRPPAYRLTEKGHEVKLLKEIIESGGIAKLAIDELKYLSLDFNPQNVPHIIDDSIQYEKEFITHGESEDKLQDRLDRLISKNLLTQIINNEGTWFKITSAGLSHLS